MAERRKSPKKVVENREKTKKSAKTGKKEVSRKPEKAIFESRKTGKSLKYLENTFEKLCKPEKSL